jgi:hypothetical protein
MIGPRSFPTSCPTGWQMDAVTVETLWSARSRAGYHSTDQDLCQVVADLARTGGTGASVR